jgi:hypothetical protein
MGRACSTIEEEEECIYDFYGRTGRKDSQERPRCKLEDNIKMDLEEI